MPPALFTSPFPKLDLSLDEKEQLHASAMEIVEETQTMYEQFLWKQKSQLDAAKWSLVREREDVRVYHDRRPGAGTNNRKMHMYLTVGSVPGTLADAMYGIVNHTNDDTRIRTSYVDDTVIDCAVLETIISPTPETPFHSLTVRWLVKGIPFLARAFQKPMDNVFVQYTGTKKFSNGEDIGFHLLQTVNFVKTPPLPQFERFNMSICIIWRRLDDRRVQAFMMGYAELEENLLLPMIVKSCADALVSIWTYTRCATMKKLAWLVKNKKTFAAQDEVGRVNAQAAGCSVCGTNDRSVRRGLMSECAVCTKYTCRKCRIKHRLSMIAPDGQLLSHEMRFCLACFTFANHLDSVGVAHDELATAEAVRAAGRSVGSSDADSRHFRTLSITSSNHSHNSGSLLKTPYYAQRVNDSSGSTFSSASFSSHSVSSLGL